MDYLVISLVAAGASLLTFFSGFGLGTLLTPAFAFFFPIELAIGLTAIVHFLNGIFKLGLIGKFARKDIILRFGLPAIASAIIGAFVLSGISHLETIYTYEISGRSFQILPVNLLLGILILSFTLFELIPKLRDMQIDKKFLSLGGLISGFFGGLSGHQGALRSAFLARTGLTKEQFIGTGTAISVMIDTARILIYSKHLTSAGIMDNVPLLTIATLSAFSGAYLGNKLLKKITMNKVQTVVSICLFVLAFALALGLI